MGEITTVGFTFGFSPRRLKPTSKVAVYRSGEPLRHPKAKSNTGCTGLKAVRLSDGTIAARLKPRPFKATGEIDKNGGAASELRQEAYSMASPPISMTLTQEASRSDTVKKFTPGPHAPIARLR
jgi:hypothetical protein